MNASTSPVVANFRQLHDLVPQIYGAGSAVVIQSAIRRAEKIFGRRLVQIPADEAAWEALTRDFVWAGHFRGRTPQAAARAWRAWVGKIRAAIRAAGAQCAADAAPAPVAAVQAWTALHAHVAAVENTFDAEGRRVLPNMASLSIANLRARVGDIHPAALDAVAARAALLRTARGKTASLRRSLRFFDRLIRERAAHPAIAHLLPATQIGSQPTLRDAALDWTAFDPAFAACVERAIATTIGIEGQRPDRFGGRLGADPLGPARSARHGRGRRIRNREAARRSLRGALSWLIRHAWPDRAAAAAGLRTLGDLMTPETIARATETYLARATGEDALLSADATATGASMLARLATLARRCALPEETLWAIEDCMLHPRIDNRQDGEMSATRRGFLRLLDADPEVPRAILQAPATLLGEAVRALEDWERLGESARIRALKSGMAAAMWSIQIARPLRTFNVNEMTVRGEGAELRQPVRAGAQAQIVIDRRRVKNRKDIEHAVPRRLWEVIAFWIDELRPRWIAIHARRGYADNDFLFPGEGGPLSRQSFNGVWNDAARLVGAPGLTPHMMRHVAATVYLAEHPGDYAVVAALLRDTARTVEQFYARGEGRQAAALFAAVISGLNAPAAELIGRRAA